MADFFGTGGSDTITGTSGDDNIFTGGGSDTINAGDGNDVVIVPAQVSPYGTLNGGNGVDTLRLDPSFSSSFISGPDGTYLYFLATFQTTTLSSFERFQFNSSSLNRFEAQFAFAAGLSTKSAAGFRRRQKSSAATGLTGWCCSIPAVSLGVQ
jgi:Ca2+-binding RTX toxin-like protein